MGGGSVFSFFLLFLFFLSFFLTPHPHPHQNKTPTVRLRQCHRRLLLILRRPEAGTAVPQRHDQERDDGRGAHDDDRAQVPRPLARKHVARVGKGPLGARVRQPDWRLHDWRRRRHRQDDRAGRLRHGPARLGPARVPQGVRQGQRDGARARHAAVVQRLPLENVHQGPQEVAEAQRVPYRVPGKKTVFFFGGKGKERRKREKEGRKRRKKKTRDSKNLEKKWGKKLKKF